MIRPKITVYLLCKIYSKILFMCCNKVQLLISYNISVISVWLNCLKLLLSSVRQFVVYAFKHIEILHMFKIYKPYLVSNKFY